MRVATYGTLRLGEPNWDRYLLDSEYIGTHRATGFDMYAGFGYPYALEGDGDITVDVFEVDAKTFKDLDVLEGYPRHYKRKLVPVGGEVAWIYYTDNQMRVENLKPVSSGDWVQYLEERGTEQWKSA